MSSSFPYELNHPIVDTTTANVNAMKSGCLTTSPQSTYLCKFLQVAKNSRLNLRAKETKCGNICDIIIFSNIGLVISRIMII